MIRSVIIDDEKNSRETLRAFIENYCPGVDVISEADSAEEGISILQAHQPDLVFLDVEMPLGSGFDLLDAVGNEHFEVVFITAHDRYAIRAIKVCALDYILKPINVDELKTAIAKVQTKIKDRHSSKQQLVAFFDNLNNLHGQLSKIVLPTLDGFLVAKVQDVIRCEADKNYTNFNMISGEKIMVSKNLKEFEELLKDFDFIRIHQTHLVNASHIERYIKGSGGYVKMSDDSIIEVSRRKKGNLMKRFLRV